MTDAIPTRSTCGIIMPISHTDDRHDEAHWAEVLNFITRAIEDAGMIAQPVWKNADYDVIQGKILKNIFDNDVIVCDVSTRNPNVMLELGMRLTTKRPTIIIAEEGTKLPFDTSIINTEFYDPNLKFSAITRFVGDLVKLLQETTQRMAGGTYHTFLESFTFETVRPSSISVSEGEAISGRLDEIASVVSQLNGKVRDLEPRPRGIGAGLSALLGEGGATRPYDEMVAAAEASRMPPTPGFDSGTRVWHEKYGAGTVAAVDGNKLEINFESAGQKRVLSSFVRHL
jgi:hypothetical protein